MPREHLPPTDLARQPFDRATGLRAIGRGQLQGRGYVNLTRGAYWVADADVTHGRRIQALRRVLPPGAVLGGLSAAWALGLRWAEPDQKVEVVLPAEHRVRPRAVLRVRGDHLGTDEIVHTDLGPATSPARTAFDLARRADPDDLAATVALLDALLRLRSTGVAAVTAVSDRHPRARGRRVAGQVLALVSPAAESPRESWLRVLLVLAGLPDPRVQYEVKDSAGRFVARLDLAWPQLRVAVEYDGAHHQERVQHSRDLCRHNALRAIGWVVIQVDARQLADPEALLAAVRAVLASRS